MEDYAVSPKQRRQSLVERKMGTYIVSTVEQQQSVDETRTENHILTQRERLSVVGWKTELLTSHR